MSDPYATLYLPTNERQTMNTCENCGTNEDIVFSGVDAFILEVNVGTICYTCANGGYEHAEEAM